MSKNHSRDFVRKFMGNKIAEIRTSAGFTNEEFASRLGISLEVLDQYETGKIRVRPSHLTRIALLLRVSLAIFFPAPEQVDQQAVPADSDPQRNTLE